MTNFPRIIFAIFVLLTQASGVFAQDFTKIVGPADRAMGRVISQSSKGISTGSGFVLSQQADGDLNFVTNRHVINGGTKITVAFKRGEKIYLFPAKVKQFSVELDYAVLELFRTDKNKGMEFASLSVAKRDIIKGEPVAALGYPGSADTKNEGFSDPAFYETTLTQGAVSKVSLGAWRKGLAKVEIVQHNANVNRGNSGGPLLDICGDVVGINTQISVRDRGGITNGTYWASSSNALSHFLDGVHIDHTTTSSGCSGGGGGVPFWLWGVLGGLLVLVAIGSVVVYGVKQSKKPENSGGKISGRKPVQKLGDKAILEVSLAGGAFVELSASQLRNGVSIGRDPSALIYKDHGKVSRQHARLQMSGRALQIVDLGSSNGTTVDGRKIEANNPVQINSKSEISLGGQPLKIQRVGG